MTCRAQLGFTTGLDILPVLAFAIISGGKVWLKDPGWWDDQVTSWGGRASTTERRTSILLRSLYGRFPTPVSDHHNGRLFGAPANAVEARIATIIPIFTDSKISYSDVRRIAACYGVSALIVTALDPVFADAKSWVARAFSRCVAIS